MSENKEILERMATALETMAQATQNLVKQQEKIAEEVKGLSRLFAYWIDGHTCYEAGAGALVTPLVNINRNLRMLNEQAFKVLESQNLLDPQAKKELCNTLYEIKNFTWYCGGSYDKSHKE
ncbi:hypothetical protein HG560_06965 [Helicobacter pylori]|uniref:Uncharacterized protein n=3 Tax=Helicobacter pylori TaxID=210 RepID=A0AAE7P5D7_HELPX|nr:hypothetical protein [Helicobacter pylori]ACD48834.1 hypothetical protein HPSH_07190 [Helicobacter pylori Shi470]ADO04562.1 hypothetical protein HPCU_07100 [Helicobacter pylori Cuz20]AFI00042.1 hypothetical protein HPSH169_06915 [Helicobacter pylori Shi169]AFI01609.1 hypothetical protein HPSH112_07130 [Helicobacter pylori Shi112]QQW92758.1 hypothetical protein HG561_06690 [Helicobacter pylori]